MKKYKHLNEAINMFSTEWEESEEEYVSTYLEFISREPEYATKIREEFKEALQDPEWSWVKKAYEHNFIGSDDSEENVLISVKELILNPIIALEN